MEGDSTPSGKDFDALLALAEQVAKGLEPMRAGGEIGAALEAEITLKCGVSDQNWLAPLVDELRFLLSSGDVSLEADDDAHEITVTATPPKKPKCVRFWHHPAAVGTPDAPPPLCGRCVVNPKGPGEA